MSFLKSSVFTHNPSNQSKSSHTCSRAASISGPASSVLSSSSSRKQASVTSNRGARTNSLTRRSLKLPECITRSNLCPSVLRSASSTSSTSAPPPCSSLIEDAEPPAHPHNPSHCHCYHHHHCCHPCHHQFNAAASLQRNSCCSVSIGCSPRPQHHKQTQTGSSPIIDDLLINDTSGLGLGLGRVSTTSNNSNNYRNNSNIIDDPFAAFFCTNDESNLFNDPSLNCSNSNNNNNTSNGNNSSNISANSITPTGNTGNHFFEGQTNTKKIHMFKEAFNSVDTDNDGKICPTELKTAFLKLGIVVSEVDVVRMINHVDIDCNGTVEFDEFVLMMQQYSLLKSDEPHRETEDSEIYDAFKAFDHNGDGFIDSEEIKQTMATLGESISDTDVLAMISEADSDQDGRIDFEEFKKVMKIFKRRAAKKTAG